MKIGKASDFYERIDPPAPNDDADDGMDVDEVPNIDNGAARMQSTTSVQSTSYSRSKRKYPELADQPLSGPGKRVRSGDASRNVSDSSTSTQTGSTRSVSGRSVHMVKDQYPSGRMEPQYESRETTRTTGSELSTFEQDFNLYSEDDGYHRNVYTSHKERLQRKQTSSDDAAGGYTASRR